MSYYALPLREKLEGRPTFHDLNDLFGEGTISQSQVERWSKKFKSDGTNLEDEEGRGRPSDFDDAVFLETVEEDESLTTRMLAEQFDVDHSNIIRCLKKLDKVWKLAGWVPHELSEHNKAKRVCIFTELLQRNEQNPFLQFLVIGDESKIRIIRFMRGTIALDLNHFFMHNSFVFYKISI
uniref:Mos1 transposase HTH domain-containing protein n=1 Tax=Acrobeloides nanus TaxID=290746 RepID=A0A914CTU9_9BILA